MARVSSAVAANNSKKIYFCLPVGALPVAPPPSPASPLAQPLALLVFDMWGVEGKGRLVVSSQAMQK